MIWCASGFTESGESIDALGLKAVTDSSFKGTVVMCSSAGVTRPEWAESKRARLVGAADIPIIRLNPGGILQQKAAAERRNRLGFLDGDGSGGLLWRTVERLAYFATRLGASGLGGALVLAPVVALFLALFLACAVKALAHNLQRLFGRKKRRRRKTD